MAATDKSISEQLTAFMAVLSQVAAHIESVDGNVARLRTDVDVLMAQANKPARARTAAGAPAAAAAAAAKFPRDVKTYFTQQYIVNPELRAKFDAAATGARALKAYVDCKGDADAKLKKEATLTWEQAKTRADFDAAVKEMEAEFKRERTAQNAKKGVVTTGAEEAAPAPAEDEEEGLKAVATATKAPAKAAKAPAAAKPKAAAATTPKPRAPAKSKAVAPAPTEEDDVDPADDM